jgi:hypothetical protein
VKESLVYQLLVAVSEDLAMDTTTSEFGLQASRELPDLIQG